MIRKESNFFNSASSVWFQWLEEFFVPAEEGLPGRTRSLRKIEHSRLSGVRSKLARKEAHDRDAYFPLSVSLRPLMAF
jgi:hypothetical protein